MLHARRFFIVLVLVLLAAGGALALAHPMLQTAQAHHSVLELLPQHLPDPPVGALVFGAVVGAILLRRRPRREPDFND